MKNIINSIKVIAIALLLSLGLSYALAWTPPTVAPPDGNVPPPINDSASSQLKSGALGVGGLFRGYGTGIFDGNVGIGTTVTTLYNSIAGNTKLAVTGSSASTDILGNTDASLSIINTDDTTGNTAGLHFAWQDTDGTPNFAGASIVAKLGTKVAGQYPSGELAFLTSNATNNAPSEKVRITTAGNVGIGTTAPGAKLEIKGTDVGVSVMNNASTQNYYFGIKDSDSNKLYIGRGKDPSQGIAPTMVMTQSDNVGIGTTAPVINWSGDISKSSD